MLAACGGEESPTSPTPRADDFVSGANQICSETEQAAEAYNDQIESAGLHSPESVPYLRRAAAERRRGLERLRDVSPPDDDAADYQAFLRDYEVNLVKLEQVADSIQQGNIDQARQIEDDVNASIAEQTDPLAAKLGIDDCAS